MTNSTVEVKDKIAEGASELFHRYGIRSVSMDDIARHLSMSKKTLYQYYKDKDELVTVGINMHMEMEKGEYDEIFEKSHDAIEELALVSRCIRKNLRDVNPSLLFDMQKYHPKAWELWVDFKNHYIKDSIAKNIERGMSEGHFRSEIDPETLAILRVEQIEMGFDSRIFPANRFDFREVQMMCLDHFIHGIVTEEGRKLFQEYLQKQQH